MDYVNNGRLKKLRMRVETDTQFFPGAKKLKVRGKELDDLPPELFVMTDLEVLDLSPERQSCINYHLSEVPGAISRLANLRVLMLDTNVIVQLPSAIGDLQNLEKLSLSNNCLKYLPEEFGNMKSLQSLHMANNDFEEFPEVVCQLENLYFLDMCDNRLKQLPESISKLRKIESLLLYMNKLMELPSGLCMLVELRTLWIGHNDITRLPRNFAQLANLDWGNRHTSSCVVDQTPLKHPPLYVCKQGIAAIENYFKVTEPQQAKPSTKQEETKRLDNSNKVKSSREQEVTQEKKEQTPVTKTNTDPED